MSDNVLFDIFADAFLDIDRDQEDDWKKLKESAKAVKQLYDSYKYVGFTEEQALGFTKLFLSAAYRKAIDD